MQQEGCCCQRKELPWSGRGTSLDISGCRFSLYPMDSGFVSIILGALEKTDTSAVWKQSDALSTVYRNLERFTEAGLLEKILFHDGVTRYSAAERHGHYLICTACDQKLRIADCPLHHIESDLARETGFTISGHDLTIYGLCPNCKENKK